MRQSRIDWLRKRGLQLVDLFRHRAQSRDVFYLVATAFFVMNDAQTFSQSLRKIDKSVFHSINRE
jgi:hypothetical protein